MNRIGDLQAEKLTEIVQAILDDGKYATDPDRIRHAAIYVGGMDPKVFDLWIDEHPEIVGRMKEHFVQSRLRADGNLWARAEIDHELELKIRERREPDWKQKQDVTSNDQTIQTVVMDL